MNGRRPKGIDAQHLEHLDVEIIGKGDFVLGTLPVSIIAQINRKGARYFHLTLLTLPELRGQELSAEDMQQAGAKLEEYEARKIV